MSYIEFKNIVKEYKMGEVKIKALDNINFEEFIVYLKTIGTIVGFVIIGLFVNFFKPLLHCTKPHYTKPHRYIVQDEINKNYEIKRGLNTTTYIPKNKR